MNYNLIALRNDAGLTRRDVEKATGAAQATVASWELGTRRPTPDMAYLLAKLYGCELEDIYEGSLKHD